MAKGKDKNKSIVGNKFSSSRRPSADELDKLAADVTGASKTSNPENSTLPKKDGRGRPHAQHGFPAFTTQIDPEKRAALKYIASIKNRKLFEIIDDALHDYLQQYKKEFPNIIP